jgi:hypothetical protein
MGTAHRRAGMGAHAIPFQAPPNQIERTKMKLKLSRFVIIGVLAIGSLGISGSAEAATRIVFPKGTYCGTYSGNYRRGREFVLGLSGDQRFQVINTGAGQQTTWSVEGPAGELEGDRLNRSTLEYYTEASGDHYVYVTSTSTRSSIKFCAY